ncbi:MAG: aldehyde dehydrogenase (NADP(+)) [Planctomycetes bacterium]|nr:aldehyde dehydrogenase (NADP(+)) [Planctomycetota bacterium]
MSAIRGEISCGDGWEAGAAAPFRAYDPAQERELEPLFRDASDAQVERAVRAAAQAFPAFRATSAEQRAALLERVASGVEALGAALLERAHAETALPLARLESERGRTCGQLRMFAKLIRTGAHLGVVRDPADPERKPLPKPDLRRRKIPLGPVAVFGASNFPLAFSAVGGDTAAALAAGCAVIVKAHPAHPGTSELVARVLAEALHELGLPAQAATFVQGASNEVGAALVRHPLLRAVAFTGSLRGGRALFDLACARPHPIPVYAEMGSTNPTVFLESALMPRAEAIARDLAGSVTLGCGQFCTNPGLLFAIAGASTERFAQALAAALEALPNGTMLTRGIAQSYREGLARWSKLAGVRRATAERAAESACRAVPALFRCEVATFAREPALQEELFGPATLLVTARDRAELLQALALLPGQLTAGIHGEASELRAWPELLATLEDKAGRLVWNGYPTGVEVSPAMLHGGPYPATTDSRVSSVGPSSIERFLRPVAYQSFPSELLPEELRG